MKLITKLSAIFLAICVNSYSMENRHVAAEHHRARHRHAPNNQPAEGHSSLHEAARTGNVHELQRLLAAPGANVNAMRQGRTALHWAAEYGHLDCVNELINAHATLDARDSKGNTPLMLALDLHLKNIYAQPDQMYVVYTNLVERMTRIFLQDLAELRELRDNLPVITRLLEAGANPSLINNTNESPLGLVMNAHKKFNIEDDETLMASFAGKNPNHEFLHELCEGDGKCETDRLQRVFASGNVTRTVAMSQQIEDLATLLTNHHAELCGSEASRYCRKHDLRVKSFAQIIDSYHRTWPAGDEFKDGCKKAVYRTALGCILVYCASGLYLTTRLPKRTSLHSRLLPLVGIMAATASSIYPLSKLASWIYAKINDARRENLETSALTTINRIRESNPNQRTRNGLTWLLNQQPEDSCGNLARRCLAQLNEPLH